MDEKRENQLKETASPMENTLPLQVPMGANRAAILRGLAQSLLINALAPWLIYTALTTWTRTPELLALLATSVPALIDSGIGIVRQRRIDFMSGVALLSIAMSLVFIALGGSPRLYLVRGSLFGMAISLAVLISFVFPKPLTYYTMRYFMTGNNAQLLTTFDERWRSNADLRFMARVQAVLWGVGLLLEGIVRTTLALTLPIPQFLLVSPFVFYGFYAALLLLSMVCGALFSASQKKRERV